MQKKQKIKAYFYILENYANTLSCGWQTAALSHPPLPIAAAFACFTTDVKSRPLPRMELRIPFLSLLFLRYSILVVLVLNHLL